MVALQKQMLTTGKMNVVENIRNANMRALANTGAFRVEAIKSASAVEQYTKALQKQDVTVRQHLKSQQIRTEVMKEQHRIQRMMAMGWSEDGRGRISADMIIPRDAPARLNSWKAGVKDVLTQQATFGEVLKENRMRMGLWNQSVQSATRNMINWGKNTQWAGRQMMVGLTIPMAAFAAASGVLAYEVDKELTRVLKVYDYATTNLEAEGERIREISMGTASAMSRAYGQSAQDTVGIIGDLAATGKTGIELQQAAQVVSRASMLGELDRQDAIKTTISLQTVFNQNTQQLAETFDYLNALENATSLSMRDMTIAIPKLAGVVQALGGDYKDMGLMMTAARSSGLEAAEAANMLKTVMFRAVSPYGRGAKTFAEKTGIDLQELVKTTNGEAIPTFQKMAAAIEAAGLTRPEKTAVFKDVFGVYQGSKALQFITELGEMNDESTQTYAAAQVGMKNAAELAGIAAQEVARMQESASGRFKIALETIKTEMAEIGEPFLEVATTILGYLTKIISTFNGFSDGSKKAILFFAGLAAVIGPITMVTGVFVTLVGTFVKMSAALLSLGARYKAVSADQFAQNLLAKQGTLAFHDQATAAKLLSYQLSQVNAQLTAMSGRNAAAAGGASRAAAVMAAPLPTPHVAGTGAGTIPVATTAGFGRAATRPPVVVAPAIPPRPTGWLAGRRWDRENPGADRAGRVEQMRPAGMTPGSGTITGVKGYDPAVSATLAAQTAATAASAEKAAKGFQNMNGSLMASAGMVGVLLGGTNQLINSVGIALMTTAALLPLLQRIAGAKAFENMGKRIVESSGRLKLFGKISGGVRTGLLALAPALGPLGLALAAAGAAFGVFFFKLKQARAEAEALNNAGEGITTAVGGTPLTEGEYMKNESTNVQADQFIKNNEKSAEALKKLGDRARQTGSDLDKNILKRRVQQIGIEVFDATGDAQKAKQAIDVALAAAGMPNNELRIDMKFDEAGLASVRQELTNVLVDNAAANRGAWYDPGMANQVQEDLKAEAKRLSQMFGQVQAGMVSTDAFEEELERVKNTFVTKGRETVEAYANEFTRAEEKIFKANNVNPNDVNAVTEALMTNTKLVNQLNYNVPTGAGASAANELKTQAEAYRYLSSQLAGKMKIENSSKITTRDLGTFHNILGDSAAKAADGMKQAGNAASTEEGALDGLTAGVEDAAQAFEDMKNAYEDAMGTVNNAVFDALGEQIEASHEATTERMEAASERRLAAIEEEGARAERDFDNRSKGQEKSHRAQDKALERSQKDQAKAVEESYDARVRAIENTMEAEQKAEQMRERMFEAEKARISRLAEMYNTNVDFNVALNSGDLDEAAKLSNNMRATQQQWALDDAQIGAGDAAEQRREQQQTEIDKINEAKTARMEALGEEQERAKELLQERQAAEKEALNDEKKRFQDSIQSRRKAEEQKTRDVIDGEKKRFDAAKKSLDMELAALKAFVPKNQAELNQHISRIEAAYGRHGFKLDTKSREWSNFVKRAMDSATATAQAQMTNSANWAKIGQDVGNEVAQGMLGMTFTQFMEWMRTGVAPVTPTAPTAGNGSRPASPRQADRQAAQATRNQAAVNARDRRLIQHGGGPAGKGSGRAGRPMTANLYSDEIPTILQQGEYVVQKKYASEAGPILEAINNGSFFHNGGAVGGVGGMFQSMIRQGLATGMAIGAQRKAAEGAQIPGGALGAMLMRTPKAGTNIGAGPGFVIGKEAMKSEGVPMGGVNLSGGFSRGEGGFPARRWRQASSNTLAAKAFIAQMFPHTNGGGDLSLSRNDSGSDHAWGKALDIFPGTAFGKYADSGGIARGNAVINALQANANRFGLKYLIWQRKQNMGRGGGWEPYNRYGTNPGPTLGHYDHVHASFRHGGGPIGVPGLKVGGTVQYDNTIANLHKNEKVLTAPLSKQLERGIGNLDAGGGVTYDITMDLRGAYIKEEVDIERAITKVLDAKVSKMGRKRVIN